METGSSDRNSGSSSCSYCYVGVVVLGAVTVEEIVIMLRVLVVVIAITRLGTLNIKKATT